MGEGTETQSFVACNPSIHARAAYHPLLHNLHPGKLIAKSWNIHHFGMDYFPGNHKYGEILHPTMSVSLPETKYQVLFDGSEIPNNQLGFLIKTLGK